MPSWDDMRAALALSRAGSLAGAARALRCDATTVARRLSRLGAASGAPMAVPGDDGRLALTPAGRAMARAAEAMEREAEAAGIEAAEEGGDWGSVRLTAVPILINHLIVPALAAMATAWPALRIELIAEARVLSLSRREADLALRFARPETGGRRHVTQRIGKLPFGVYGAPGRGRGWIGYEDRMAHLPQARWTEAQDGARAAIRVSDLETAREAAAAGLGRAALPRFVGDSDPRLERLQGAPPGRELWLVRNAGRARGPAEAAVAEWIATLVPG